MGKQLREVARLLLLECRARSRHVIGVICLVTRSSRCETRCVFVVDLFSLALWMQVLRGIVSSGRALKKCAADAVGAAGYDLCEQR